VVVDEGAFHEHLLVEVDLGELHAIRFGLLEPTAVLDGSGSGPTTSTPKAAECRREFPRRAAARPGGRCVEQDQSGLQIAVAGMGTTLDHCAAMAFFDICRSRQHSTRLAARTEAVEAHHVSRSVGFMGRPRGERPPCGPAQNSTLSASSRLTRDRCWRAVRGRSPPRVHEVVDLDRGAVELDVRAPASWDSPRPT